MKSKLIKAAALMAPLAVLTGCVDTSYDLSDIDATTEIKIDNLVIPVRIDPLKLGDFFEPEGEIKEVTMGDKTVYAITKEGSFESANIEIPEVSIDKPQINEVTTATLQLTPASRPAAKPRARLTIPGIGELNPEDYQQTYTITKMGNPIEYDATDVDPALKAIKSAQVSAINAQGQRSDIVIFKIKLTVYNLETAVKDMILKNVVILAPVGLHNPNGKVCPQGEYDPVTGQIKLDELHWGPTGGELSIITDQFSFAGATINPGSNGKNNLHFGTQLYVNSGTVTLVPNFDGVDVSHITSIQDIPTLPTEIGFKAEYFLDNKIYIDKVSATIEYTLDDLSIDPVDLTDLPDFLDDPKTNLVLASPQIYLNLNNPVADVHLQNGGKGLEPTMSIAFTPIRDDYDNKTWQPSEPLKLYANKGISGPYNYVLAPQAAPLSIPDGFENPKQINFDGMRYLLGVTPEQLEANDGRAGLPKQINIDIESPKIPTTAVEDFELGKSYEKVTGKYELLAPLALGNKSMIIYSGTSDWDNSDIEDLHISKLSVACDAVSELPINANLTVNLMKEDGNGNLIPFTEADGVTCTPITLEAGKTSHVEIAINIAAGKTISDIAGIEYVATLWVDGNEDALSPEQTITVSNVKATISGSYITNFK